jgi:methionyl-tRNA formyltransferase
MKKKLRILFMGTPDFAVASLKLLVQEGWNVVAVVTAQDKPQGRGRKPKPSPVKAFATEHQLPVLQPPNLKSHEFLETLRGFRADLQVIVAFRMLPEVVWSMPKMGTFNLHASLLPDYRGAAPINWVLINGETKTGLTTFFLQQEIDTGNILFQEEEPIVPEDNAGTLHDRLMHKGAALVRKTVEAIAEGSVHPKAQDPSKAVHQAPKIHKETCEVDWKTPAVQLHNLIRGLSPYPAAWCWFGSRICKLYRSQLVDQSKQGLQPGEFTTDYQTYLHVQTGEGMLAIMELQLAGKKRMEISDFLRGNTATLKEIGLP